MNNSLFLCAVCAVVVGGETAVRANALAYTPIDHPGANTSTEIRGIDAGRLVGHYFIPSGEDHGFLYDGLDFMDLDYPAGPDVTQSFPTSIDGDRVVGYYYSGPTAFVHDLPGGGFTTLTHPDGHLVQPEDTDAGRIVGYHYDASTGAPSGFIHDGAVWTDLNYPGSGFTNVTGIDGQTVVGYYTLPGDFVPHGFSHVLGTRAWTALNYPGSVNTTIWDIDGGRIVGEYWTAARQFGFLYENGTWTSLDIPSAIGLRVTGIDGDQIAGGYFETEIRMRGFVATIPEPSTLTAALLLLGVVTPTRWVGRGRFRGNS